MTSAHDVPFEHPRSSHPELACDLALYNHTQTGYSWKFFIMT